MEHHADFAISVQQHVSVETGVGPDDGLGPIAGQVIALGWWVQPESVNDPDHEPTGTLYLVVDERRPRPYWVKQADLRGIEINTPTSH